MSDSFSANMRWLGVPEQFRIGDYVWIYNPPSLLDRALMAFGFRRRSPDYRAMQCVDEHVALERVL